MQTADFCGFDNLSDDVLLQILLYVPRCYWCQVKDVNTRFRNICNDKAIFRRSYLECAYGLSEQRLGEYLRSGNQYIEVLNLNYCHWFTSTALSSLIPRCKKIHKLCLLDCRLTTKGLSRILCALPCLKALTVSVSNMLDFSNEINSNSEVQNSLKNMQHFCLHIREESPQGGAASLQFHLSQQTTLIEYCPNLETFCVVGHPGTNQKLSKRLIHPLIVKRENMSNLKTMSINCTNDATARLFFFGILIVAFEVGVHFKDLSVSGLDLIQAVKKSYFFRSLQDSCQTLENLDLSKVHLDDLEASVRIQDARLLKYLNLSDVRSTSSCIGLMKVADGCPNLVSLNLRGATSGHRFWKQAEMEHFKQLLRSCQHLKHINLSGIHVHEGDATMSMCGLLTTDGNKGLQSLSLPVCCLTSPAKSQTQRDSSSVSRGFSKRIRLSQQPTPSTSRDQGEESPGSVSLEELSQACPGVSELELINAGFLQSVIHISQKRNMYEPCKESYSLTDRQLVSISNWTNLRYLQLTGLPGVTSRAALEKIGRNCTRLETLHLAYFGLGAQLPQVWQSLQYFQSLISLRLEQPYLKLDEHLFSCCLNCRQLQRLCVVSKKTSIEPAPLESFVQKATSLYVLQLFTDTFLNVCERLQSSLARRYESVRPGFSVCIHPLQHEKLANVIADVPLKLLEELTLLTSRVATKSPHFMP